MPVHPVLQGLLDQLAAAGNPPATEQTPEQMRAGYALLSALGAAPDHPLQVEDRTIPGDVPVPVRIYRPDASGPLPVVVFFHGGGFTLGSIDTHDPLARHLTAVPAVVVSVGYRLAPEHRFPAAVEDADTALRWVAEHASELGGDPARVAVAGDSAGGNLSAVVARRARDHGGPPLAYQVLIYPATDLTRSYPSHRENGTGYLLTTESMEWFGQQYLGPEGGDLKDPDLSPQYAEDLSGLPPAMIVTGEYDPLRDEGEAYGELLSQAGVPVHVKRYPGMIHAFFQMDGLLPEAGDAIHDVVSHLRQAFGT